MLKSTNSTRQHKPHHVTKSKSRHISTKSSQPTLQKRVRLQSPVINAHSAFSTDSKANDNFSNIFGGAASAPPQKRFVERPPPSSQPSTSSNQPSHKSAKYSQTASTPQTNTPPLSFGGKTFTNPRPPQTDVKKFQSWLFAREEFSWQNDPNCQATVPPNRTNVTNRKKYLEMIDLVRNGKRQELSQWFETNQRFVDLNAQDFFGSTPLCTASKKHLFGVVMTLLKHGADPNYPSSTGTPLMHASATLDLPIIQALIEAGGDVNRKLESTGQNALMVAVSQTNVAYPLYLLDHGANINDCDASGRTALMFAVRKGSVQMIAMLLEHGSAIEITDNYGFTALHYAKQLPSDDPQRGPKCSLLEQENERDGGKKVLL